MSSHLKSRLGRFAVTAVILFAAAGCGAPPGPALPRPATNIPGQLQPVSSVQPASETAAYGTYTGTLFKLQWDGSSVSQPFSLVLSQASSGYGATGAFSSSGPAGTFNYTLPMEIGRYNYTYNNTVYYSFLSSRTTDASFSDVSFKIQLIVALSNNGTTFDPTQSSMNIKDCGFSDSCSNDAQDVWFGASLGKR